MLTPESTGSHGLGYVNGNRNYHSVQSPENNAAIMDGVRKTYDGPLALARDLMVINVTKDTIKVRMATVDEYVLPPDVGEAYKEEAISDEQIQVINSQSRLFHNRSDWI